MQESNSNDKDIYIDYSSHIVVTSRWWKIELLSTDIGATWTPQRLALASDWTLMELKVEIVSFEDCFNETMKRVSRPLPLTTLKRSIKLSDFVSIFLLNVIFHRPFASVDPTMPWAVRRSCTWTPPQPDDKFTSSTAKSPRLHPAPRL